MASTAPTLDERLEIAPPPPRHPLRLRRVLDLLRTVSEDAERTDAAMQIFDAVGGDGGERTFQRFVQSAAGRRLIAESPVLVERMADRESLAELPDGSLGRAYLAFRERNGFAADGLVRTNNEVEREGQHELDPLRSWFWDRYTAMHDLWHVVTGCDTSQDGESLLLAFAQAQTPQRGYRFLLGLIVVKANVQLGFQATLARAWWRGRRAQPLVRARWEELLPLPLDEVRELLGVRPLMNDAKA